MSDFACPQCRTLYRLEGDWSGRRVQCDNCGHKFNVAPAAAAAPETLAPAVPGGRRNALGRGLALAGGFAAGAAALAFVILREPYAIPPPSAPPPPDGLLHQWNFDEVRDWHDSPFDTAPETPARVLDLAGGLDAAQSGFTGRDWVSGREFMALRFSGPQTRLVAGPELARALGGTATLAFWCRTSQRGGAAAWSAPGIAGAVAARRSHGVQWGWLDAEGHVNLSADSAPLARSARPVNDDRWHFVALTRDATTGTGQVYVDGEPGASHTGPRGCRQLACQSIGRIEGAEAGAGCYSGRLDKVTVYNRVLTPAEVRDFMANHAPKAWDTFTAGTAGRPFVTASPMAWAYDAESDALTVRRWTSPAHGSVVPLGDGSFTYTPAPDFKGTDRFDVVVQDGRGGLHLAAMRVSVEAEPSGGGLPTTTFAGLQPLRAADRDLAYPGWRVPRVTDWDGDGNPDLLVGAGGGVWFHGNRGSRTLPAFAAGVRVQAADGAIASGDGACPIALADLTGDGRTDVVIADARGRLRVYARTTDSGRPAALAAAVTIKQADGTDFTLPDRRFDLGDWNGDGRPDLVTGTRGGAVKLFLNAGTPTAPRLAAPETLFDGSYNLYPRFCDLDGNGQADLARGINWGGVCYWLNVGEHRFAREGDLVILRDGGQPENLRATDGAMVDVADLNGDGLPDLVVGGHAGEKLFLALGERKTVADHVRAIERIYDAHAADLGAALSANTNALLHRVNEANRGLANMIQNGSPNLRAEVFAALAAHVRKYAFLKRQPLELPRFHHVPSIALQNIVFLRYAQPDTLRHRREVADLAGLTGTARDIFLACGLALGDNGKLNEAQLGAVRDFMRHHPRPLFPDCLITFDQLYGDERGGLVWTPDSCKNTFGCDVGNANEWARDLTEAIEAAEGRGAAHGDYFTFVMGHEVTHSLDGYVRSRANRDLARRWGQVLCRAAGPLAAAGPDGWIAWDATRQRFEQAGAYAPATQKWEAAWEAYWKRGAGAAFRQTSFMRGNIDWFMHAPQESLATQANHHWANAPGRLIAAVARFRTGVESGNAPMKANLTEVVDFIDYQSAGLNRVALPKTATQREPVKQVDWTIHLADLTRDDRGRITRIEVGGRTYDFELADDGAVTDVRCGADTLPP